VDCIDPNIGHFEVELEAIEQRYFEYSKNIVTEEYQKIAERV
jgi:hypothetical protein